MYRMPFSCIVLLWTIFSFGQPAEPGKAIPSWEKGYLDIHHINTGRGSSTYFILPDGTTMLVDAGELSPLDTRTFTPRNAAIRPNDGKKPYEWIVHYIRQVSPAMNKALDYALITHFHDDHFGAWYPDAPVAPEGNYLLTGITGVASLLPVHRLIDRGAPSYHYPYDIKHQAAAFGGGEIKFDKTMHNYFSFIAAQQKKGMSISALKAGSDKQIVLQYDAPAFPAFQVRNVKSNQWIWTGKDSTVFTPFPGWDSTDRRTWPDENSLSLAITVQYGSFLYYTGGDNAGNIFYGDKGWRDTETPMARAIGEVDVATMDHHGNRDAVNEFQVKTLKPRVWIGQTWSADHPGHEVLIRMTTPHLYSEPRDLFATNMLEANRQVIGPLIDRSYKSQQGHILVRVLPGGNSYYVIVLDDGNEHMPVKSVFGPYQSKTKQ